MSVATHLGLHPTSIASVKLEPVAVSDVARDSSFLDGYASGTVHFE
jgi:hypothetical protein